MTQVQDDRLLVLLTMFMVDQPLVVLLSEACMMMVQAIVLILSIITRMVVGMAVLYLGSMMMEIMDTLQVRRIPTHTSRHPNRQPVSGT